MTGTTNAVECPLCDGDSLGRGLLLRNIPVHTVVLHHSREEALSQPCADMDLACCKRCGFVFNAAYDPALHHYSEDYEATQSFSGTFNAFNQAVAADVAIVCRDRPGPVVEVGCGQGEFLVLLKQHGIGRLAGFDPAFDPGRSAIVGHPSIAMHNCRFLPEAVVEPPAGIVCKMTLEHIAKPIAFLSQIASLARRSKDCPVFIQVPNARTVFETGSFWDVYYEHCCYFSPATLTHAMTMTGLSVEDLRNGFEGQYLIARARADSGFGPARGREYPVECELDRFHAFCTAIRQNIAYWRQWAACTGHAGRVALWGGGSKAVAFLSATGIAGHVAAAIDINPRKAGTYLAGSGVPVVSPDTATDLELSDIVLLNPAYKAEVDSMMRARGIAPRLHMLDNACRENLSN